MKDYAYSPIFEKEDDIRHEPFVFEKKLQLSPRKEIYDDLKFEGYLYKTKRDAATEHTQLVERYFVYHGAHKLV